MILIEDFIRLDPGCLGGALTIGNFDGVHLGHADILRRVRDWADQVRGPAVVLTFDPHPVRLLRPESAPPPLTWIRRKAELLGRQGIDFLIAYPTDRSLLALDPHTFFRDFVVQRLNAKALVEGPNFHFGHRREGDVRLLGKLCGAAGIEFEIVPPRDQGGAMISSSRVREALGRGEVGAAREMLTEPYRLRGMVVHGERRGTPLGFPTANLDAIDTLIPTTGVYAGRAFVRGVPIPAAIHIGPAPTFSQSQPRVEAHLLDFHGNLYGEPLEIEFLDRLRDVRRFSSSEQLVEQLHHDLAATRAVATAF